MQKAQRNRIGGKRTMKDKKLDFEIIEEDGKEMVKIKYVIIKEDNIGGVKSYSKEEGYEIVDREEAIARLQSSEDKLQIAKDKQTKPVEFKSEEEEKELERFQEMLKKAIQHKDYENKKQGYSEEQFNKFIENEKNQVKDIRVYIKLYEDIKSKMKEEEPTGSEDKNPEE